MGAILVVFAALPEIVASAAEAYGHCKFQAERAITTISLVNNSPHCKVSRWPRPLAGDASLQDAEGTSICSFQFTSIPFLVL
jgi:hypothetical protein